jgi:type II secretory pathway pseudopilin PulG
MKLHDLRHARSPRNGYTLVELSISAIVMTVLFGAVAFAMVRANGAYQQDVTSSTVNTQAQRLLERIANEFLDASHSSIKITPVTPNHESWIEYTRPNGFAGTAVTFGPKRRLVLRYSTTDSDNGVDDNSNGLVDECTVALIPDVLGDPTNEIALGSGVSEYLEGELPNLADDNGNGLDDERGLCATYDATSSTLTLRLTIERVGPGGVRLARTAQTSIRLRN